MLRTRGVQNILLYDWAPAGYQYTDGEKDNPLVEWTVNSKSVASLNPDGPFPHCEEGYSWCKDCYFDFGCKEVIKKKAEFLINSFAAKYGYNGIFFDWASGMFIEEKEYSSMKENFERRYPGDTYQKAIGNFYNALKKENKTIMIVTNQGFRNPDNVLNYTDYDMTESYGTDYNYFGKRIYVKGRGIIEIPQTIYYPVSSDIMHGSLKDSVYYLDYLNSLKEHFNHGNLKNIVYMNYAAPEFTFYEKHDGTIIYQAKTPRNAIFFGYALAKLRNFISYTEVPFNNSLEEDNIYFYDLGKPLGKNYRQVNGGYVRYYERGFVVAGNWQNKTRITLTSSYIRNIAPVYDLYERKWAGISCNGKITIEVKPVKDELTGKMAPSGRVYLYPFFINPSLMFTTQ